jgi:hypothetical protein
VLTSPTCAYVKIGGTDYAPMKRIREINSCEPYKSHGPWSLHDFRQVYDWRKVESSIHYAYRSKLVRAIKSQKELFAISRHVASRYLESIDPALIVRKPKVDRMFNDQEFARYLAALFRMMAILNWLDLQGAWTFSLFPSTVGGRYFTLSIGRHEVAYATMPGAGDLQTHMILMDSLVRGLPEVRAWVRGHGGSFRDGQYDSALDRSTSVCFQGTFDTAVEFLGLPGVRRAVIAYWNEALIGLKERASTSMFARFHSWNAVAELKKRIEANQL